MNKFLTQTDAGVRQLTAGATTATPDSLVSTGPTGVIDASLLPPEVGENTESLETTENLSAGAFVNQFDDAGTSKVRLANAATGRLANGFVTSSFVTGETATVIPLGQDNTARTGLTPGTNYWLSNASPGNVVDGATLYANVANGHYYQLLGVATSTTTLETGKYTPTEYQAA